MPIVAEVIYLVAIAFVWARGSIFKRIRESIWPKLLDCPLCSGFWIGVLGQVAFAAWPRFMSALGLASLVGTLSLVVYGAIRRI